jgi:CDP-glucose 4,6-dehydratase
MNDQKKLFHSVYADKPVLVTGHTGFKGSWLTLWLSLLGARVTGFSTCRPLEPRNFTLCGLEGAIARHWRGDVRDRGALARCVADTRPDIIFHLAAQPIVLDSYDVPAETIDVNLTGTVNVLEAARTSGSVRAVVVVTTDKVYSEVTDAHGKNAFTEEASLAGHDPYSASKAMAELAVRSYRLSWKEDGFSKNACALATARAGNAFGGGDFAPHRLLTDCFRSLPSGKQLVLKTPDSVRPWQSVLEPTSAYLWLGARLLEEGDAFAEAWNFGPTLEDRVTCERLTRRVFELWGAKFSPEIRPIARHQAVSLLIDSSKAANLLGWIPTWTWEEAAARAVEWFLEYESRRGGSGDGKMRDVCERQIALYIRDAKRKGIAWTL